MITQSRDLPIIGDSPQASKIQTMFEETFDLQIDLKEESIRPFRLTNMVRSIPTIMGDNTQFHWVVNDGTPGTAIPL